MKEITKYLKFDNLFDKEKLAYDLSLIIKSKWIPHFNTNGYQGEWDVISLYAQNGDESNIFALPTSKTKIKETPILKKCLYFKEVIDFFKCPILTARILKLKAGSEIKPHTDHELGYEDGNFRLHIPIITNNKVQFLLDGDELKMLPGECWYTNVNYVHSVKNLGEIDRIHLVIDGKRNKWSDKMFFSKASKENLLSKPIEKDSPETIKKIIEELKRSNEPISKQLINELQLKLRKLNKK